MKYSVTEWYWQALRTKTLRWIVFRLRLHIPLKRGWSIAILFQKKKLIKNLRYYCLYLSNWYQSDKILFEMFTYFKFLTVNSLWHDWSNSILPFTVWSFIISGFKSVFCHQQAFLIQSIGNVQLYKKKIKEKLNNEWMKWLLLYRLSSGKWPDLKAVHSTYHRLTDGLPTWVKQSKDTCSWSTFSFLTIY